MAAVTQEALQGFVLRHRTNDKPGAPGCLGVRVVAAPPMLIAVRLAERF